MACTREASTLDQMTIAAWQCHPTRADPRANAERMRVAAHRARAAGARVLVAPELVLTGYDIGQLDRELLTDAVELVAEVARDADLAVVAGVARTDRDGLTRNSVVAVEASGTVSAVHDKTQPFGDLDDRFEPGDEPVTVADLAGLRIGLLVCYEIEFPEPARLAALSGVDLLAVPTANMEPHHGVHDVLVRARALENGVPVAYANHVGSERRTRYLGRSLLVHGDGSVRAEGSPDQEEVLIARLGPGASTQLDDRRPDMFAGLSHRIER